MVRKLIAAILLVMAGIFGTLFYQQYFRWRDCFNELGRCYDSETGMVFLAQSGIFWGSTGVAALIAFVWAIWPRKSR